MLVVLGGSIIGIALLVPADWKDRDVELDLPRAVGRNMDICSVWVGHHAESSLYCSSSNAPSEGPCNTESGTACSWVDRAFLSSNLYSSKDRSLASKPNGFSISQQMR